MGYFKKFLMYAIALCFLSFPAMASAVYDAQYLDLSNEIFDDDLWTGFEDGTLDSGADYYHVWYENGDVRADYWYSENADFTAEWMIYQDSGTGDSESFSHVASKDGTYVNTLEAWYWDDTGEGDYLMYDDGFESGYDYYSRLWGDDGDDFTSDDEAYWEEIWNYASGSYYLYYDYESEWVDWTYEYDYDLSDAEIYEYQYYFDVPGEQYWEDWHKESLATGSYEEHQWEYTITSEYDDVLDEWSYENNSYELYHSTYSADYSETSYYYYFNDNDNDWYYEEEGWEVSDSGYYYFGYYYNNYGTGSYERYNEGFDNNSAQGFTELGDTGWGVESTWWNYDTEVYSDGDYQWEYYARSYEFSSGSFYYYQYAEDWMGSYFEQTTLLQGWSGSYEDSYYEAYYNSDMEFVSSFEYENQTNSFTGADYYEEWSTDVDGDIQTDYNWGYVNNPRRNDYLEWSNYDWNDDASSSEYYEYEWSRENLDSGSRYEGYENYSYDGNTGDGYYEYSYLEYDSMYQETYFEYDYKVYTNTYATYDLNYEEWLLADSDESYTYWELDTRSEGDGSSLTYETYTYSLDSDYGWEEWDYYYRDYTGANDTTWMEEYEENLFSGYYEYHTIWTVETVSETETWEGQDLDYYWSEYSEEIDGVSISRWYYELALASGIQYWESYNYDDTTGDESYLFLTDGADTAWVGYQVDYEFATDTFDLYLYESWSDSYFLTEDLDVLPAGYELYDLD